MNNEFINIAKKFKRQISGKFILTDGGKIKERIAGEDFFVTRKLDGSMQMLFYRNGDVCAYSTHGNEKRDLPCLEEFGNLCKAAGLTSATVAGELYARINGNTRERVCDVSTAFADKSLHNNLFLAPFDIVDLDGKPFHAEHYKETHAKLVELFSGTMVKPVEGVPAASKEEVADIYNQWAVAEGSEGLVVHSELPFIYKIKPRHSIDCVILGYTIGEDERFDMIRDLLVGVMEEDGNILQFATVGGGFSEDQRRSFLSTLSQMHVNSEYVETDSRNVAFQMVRPEIIVEVSVVDLVAENSKGEPKMTMSVSYNPETGYAALAQKPGVSAHSPNFERIREDKTCNSSDIRMSQISDLCPLSEAKSINLNGLPQSELLVRRIYTKGEGAKFMIQKYVIWKTNKEDLGAFPAYVFHYTDFSLGRSKDQLKRDVRVSNSKDQIFEIMDQFIAENVKKGWAEKID